MKLIDNSQIAKILYEIADYYAMEDRPFKPRAYEKAAGAVADFDRPLYEIYQEQGLPGLFAVPGVGKGIAEHLEEFFKTGHFKKYEQMKKRMPVNLGELRSVPGLGPKKVKVLYEKLKIQNLQDLARALAAHKIQRLPGFGPKSEEEIAIAFQFQTKSRVRYPLGQVESIVEEIKDRLEKSGLFKKLMIGGSYRRRQETVGDIDILAISRDPTKAMDFFVKMKAVKAVLEHGETRSEIRLLNNMPVDLRIIPEKSWGAASQYFTGDKAHNIRLRKLAIAKGYKLSEYGVFRGKKTVAGKTEEEVYRKLGLEWMPAEIRTDSGEIEAAQKHQLPKLLEYGSVRGDLQVQTNWTDGMRSIEEMARSAKEAGLEYIAITDHTKTLYMTGGLDERKLIKQMGEIDKLNAKLKAQNAEFKILKGAEVNILKDGSLDIADKVLKQLEVVGVSVHSHFKMPSGQMTLRLVKALSNPHVDIFFHPTTRLINRRAPIEFDFEEILRVCQKNRVALEINAYPDRLDLHDTLIRQAVAAGVKLVIDSDAHHPGHFKFLKYGEAQARRGWATKNDILNTKPVEELLKYFKK